MITAKITEMIIKIIVMMNAVIIAFVTYIKIFSLRWLLQLLSLLLSWLLHDCYDDYYFD